MLRKTLFFFIYLSNCASVHWLKTDWILQQKFFSSSLEAHGWEVDTLAGFLWDPMHKNDLKSPPNFTYSSLTARKSEMINWNWDYQLNNFARITHEFWTFQQPARNLCFFYECWMIWQQVLDWRLDWSGMCRYTYIPAIPYLYLLRSYCVHFNILRFHYTTLETLSIRLFTEYFISWTLLYTSITQHYWVVVTYNFSSIDIDFNLHMYCS